MELLRFPGMNAVPGLVHAVTTRDGGVSRGPFASLNLGRAGDDPDLVRENRRRVAEGLGLPAPPRFPAQVHGARVLRAEELAGGPPPEGDAVVCATPGVACGVLGADCPGVLLVDPARRALAVVHSGWRGTVAGVVPAALAVLVRDHGADPARVRAAIGPGISSVRYEVGPDVAREFEARFARRDGVVVPGRGDRFHVGLCAAIRAQLVRAGVRAAQIEVLAACTFDDARFYSHRRDGASTGRHALVAMWA